MNEHQPGLLIKFIRLNVPCNDGGYVKINQNISMCGKLEEIAENRRLLYLPNFSNTSLTTFNNPKFNIHYNLVDYCYNTTLLDQNNSILIKPIHSRLDCYFKIHLPYGNRISINLVTNVKEANYASFIDEYININMSTIKKPYRSIRKNDNHNYVLKEKNENIFGSDSQGGSQAFMECFGIMIEITSLRQKWVDCVDSVKTKKVYKFTSDYNILHVKVTKKDLNQLSEDNTYSTSQDISLRLDYTAFSINELVSQCSFGWILVGDFCMSIVSKSLPWDNAEKECNNIGGHLASIRSENDQLLVDKLLLNR